MNKDHLGIDPDLQRPALAVVQGQDVVFVSVLKTSDSRQQSAVIELAQESMHWIDTACEELCFAGHNYPNMASLTIEAQQLYRGKTKNPQDIVLLGSAAGVSLTACCMRWPNATPMFPLPKEWKKDVPKHIHQARIYKRLNVPCSLSGGKTDKYCVPEWPKEREPIGADRLNKSDWKHVGDAIGLALYGQSKIDSGL